MVNESSLTGEIVPKTKTPASHNDDTVYSPEDIALGKKCTVFCGSQILQT
jgi:magnesium-transporting ATPase (P-type)